MRTPLLAAVISFLLAAISLSLNPSVASAVTLTVNTLEDELNSDGDCSLREAVTAANTNAAVDACPGGAIGVDTLAFSVANTITLASTLPLILDDLIFNGPGPGALTLSGNDSVGVLKIDVGISVEVHSLTIARSVESGIVNHGTLTIVDSTFAENSVPSGSVGGGAVNGGTLTIIDSTFVDNSGSAGGGVYNGGTLTIIDSKFVGNNDEPVGFGGGGIYNALGATLTITQSRFAGNSSVHVGAGAIENEGRLRVSHTIFEDNNATVGYGAILNSGEMWIMDSTFRHNSSIEFDGAINTRGNVTVTNTSFINNSGSGVGGINNSGTLLIVNSTFSANNSLLIGAILNRGKLRIVNSTIAHTPGPLDSTGLWNEGEAEVANTIISLSDVTGGGRNCFGTITSLGHNLDSDGSCNLTGPGDIPNGFAGLDPAPADNGGSTPTLALLPGSDAIDAGDNAICAAEPVNNIDQRGLPRPVDGNQDGNAICDIGAYELQPEPGGGIITIVHDSQPNSAQDFRYSGDLGNFRLDNVIPPDNDVVLRRRTFEVESGVYTVRQEVPGNWLLTNITCDPAENAAVDLVNQQVTITHADDSAITCTFTNQRKSIVRIVAYKDSNGDAKQNPDERPLNQWPILLYNAQGNLIPTADNLTNQEGKESYPGLVPGNYTVCIELREGWVNTQPGLIDTTYQQPCYVLTVGPGQIGQVSFGNADWPVASAAQPDASGSVVIFDMPDSEATDETYSVIDTDEAWLNAPLQAPSLFMPFVMSKE